MDYSISENFTISPKTEMSLYNSNITYMNNNSNEKHEIFPKSLNLITHFVHKIKDNKMEPYFLFGPNVKVPIYEKNKSTEEFNNSTDFAIDLGVGLEKTIKGVIFAPELRYSFGLLNINQNPIFQRFYHNNISLIFNFK